MNCPDGWRFVGKYAEGPCQVCSFVFSQREMPDYGDARCSCCRALSGAKDLVELAESLVAQRDRLTAELEEARRQIGKLEDDLFAARKGAA